MKKLIVMLICLGLFILKIKFILLLKKKSLIWPNKVKDLQTQVEKQTDQISIYDELMKKYENQLTN